LPSQTYLTQAGTPFLDILRQNLPGGESPLIEGLLEVGSKVFAD